MINFKQYPNMTKCVILDGTPLSNTDFSNAFSNMRNLKNIILPNDITNLYNTFHNCTNLATAICGPNVTNMYRTYMGCTNLTTAVCGHNVTSMYDTYSGCTNLTTAVCGPNVTNMANAYYNCVNIHGNTYLYANSVSNFRNCFYKRNVSNMLNIYVHAETTTNTALTNITNTRSLVGETITWTDNTANSCKYNATKNIYIYYVNDVDAARIANGDPDYMGNL